MNQYKCMVVDDEAVAQRIIISYLKDIPGFEVSAVASNALEAMSILETTSVDLMFLDIEMPKLKGLAFLKTLENPPPVIITTAHREYAYDSYDLDVVDYLLKPISFERFLKAINRFKKDTQPVIDSSVVEKLADEFVYVKSDRKTLKLAILDIQYIESMNNYIIIHMPDARHVVYNSMTSMLAELDETFVRIHKSYAVNKSQVIGFSKELVMIGKVELPIGKAYKGEIGKL